MRFQLTIDTDNAAFEADELELQRCIKNVANRVGRREFLDGFSPYDDGKVLDANGNSCGTWTLNDDS